MSAHSANVDHDSQLAQWRDENGLFEQPLARRLTPEQKAEQSARAKNDAFANRHHYAITLAIEGRIRFLSHLEMVDTLLGALRRAGVTLALSEGMRPKPRIKVAMPRPVAAEAWADIVEVELTEHIDADQFAFQLADVLPLGLTLISVAQIPGAYASAASRVSGAMWRFVFDDATDRQLLDACVSRAMAADELLVERISPRKHTRTVNVRQFIDSMHVVSTGDAPSVRVFITLTQDGLAKPDEVVRALASLAPDDALASDAFAAQRVIRESITLLEPGDTGAVVASPELVGADVPDGPEKPWGAC